MQFAFVCGIIFMLKTHHQNVVYFTNKKYSLTEEIPLSKASYDAKDIQVLEGLDAVRLRPGMYIGTTGQNGLHHLLWEIVDNAVDEAANGFCNKIEITLHQDGSVTVSDNGRGIPTDIHPQLGVSGVEVVFTQLHAGGKFNNDNYSYSGGLHGVGASVTNALSRWLEITVCRNGKEYFQRFESNPSSDGKKIESGIPTAPLKEIGKSDKHGTSVTFLADDRVFHNVMMNRNTIEKRVKELAFLNKGIHFVVCDERVLDESKHEFKYDGGLVDFVKDLNSNKVIIHQKVMTYSAKNETLEMEFAFQYTNGYSENLVSYVNNIPTPEGGTHETGWKTAMTKVFNEYARSKNLLKAKEDNLLGEDFREGITAVLSIKMKNVQFEGQTKSKLGNIEAKTACEALAQEGFATLLASSAKDAETIKTLIANG